MRVLVCGGRDFRSPAHLFKALEEMHKLYKFTALMQGGARGADAMARDWATTHPEIQRFVCKADWDRYGRAAGSIRNSRMLEWKPDMVIAFPTPGAENRGTNDMVHKARAAGVEVRIYGQGE